jgi:oxalate---CoA ligase
MSNDGQAQMTRENSTDPTLSALLREQAEKQPDAIAILAPDRPPLTCAGLWRQVQNTVDTLQSLGVTPSTRVAVVLPNGPEMATTFLGVAAGAVCAPLNPAYRAAELQIYLEDTRAQFVIVGKGQSDPVRAVAMHMNLTVLEIASDSTLPAGQFSLGSPSRDGVSERIASASHDIALILHTSGTTARPKIVPLSHANLVASARNIARNLALRPTDRCLNVMPLFHIHGLVGALLASMAGGSSVVCTPGFDDHAFFDWVAQYDPTWYTAVPTMHQSVVAQGARYRKVAPRHRFRFVRSSSSALPPKVFESLQALTGAPVVEAYGMTEASHEMASNPLSGSRKSGSVGVPTGVEMALMDESGQLLANGKMGEIVIRGSGVTAGYENNPEANALAFIDGWFRTGDQGRLDDEGYLYVSGRLKELVNRGGEKVSPREVDEALLEHHAVEQAAAFAVPHPTLGEDLLAIVVARPDAKIDGATLRTFLSERLAYFKVPSQILLVKDIPKGPTGKVQRDQLHGLFGHLAQHQFVAPRSDVERSLDLIFQDVLGCGPVGVDDDFFSIGGDSLKGAQVVARIRTRHAVEITVPIVFAHRTIATLAAQIEVAKANASEWHAKLESDIGQMSDEEVARLLAKEGIAVR